MIYISGPISPLHGYTIQQNAEEAFAVYLQLVRAGKAAVCVQLDALLPSDIPYKTWMRFDFAVIDCCDTVLMLPRWRDSKGAVREHEYALLKGKRVVYDVGELL